jgi:hypothetical protein
VNHRAIWDDRLAVEDYITHHVAFNQLTHRCAIRDRRYEGDGYCKAILKILSLWRICPGLSKPFKVPPIKWLHHLSKANWSLSNLASMLRLNLFA